MLISPQSFPGDTTSISHQIQLSMEWKIPCAGESVKNIGTALNFSEFGIQLEWQDTNKEMIL